MTNRTAIRGDELTAYHEAGHAVAAVRLRLPFVRATIEPDEGSLGCVLLASHAPRLVALRQAGIVTPAMRERLLAYAMLAFAGAAGAGLARRRDWDWTGAGQDERDVWHYLMAATPDVHHPEGGESPALQALADYCRARTLDLIRGNADRVRSVADALIEHRTLKANRVRAIVKDGDAPPPSDGERATMDRLRRAAQRAKEQAKRERLIRTLASMPETERHAVIEQARRRAAKRGEGMRP